MNHTFRLLASLLLVVLYSSVVAGKNDVSAGIDPVVDAQYTGYIDQSIPHFQYNHFNNSSELNVTANVVTASLEKNTADKAFAVTRILIDERSTACLLFESASGTFSIKFPPREIVFPFHFFW